MKQEQARQAKALEEARNDKVGMELRLEEMDWLKDP